MAVNSITKLRLTGLSSGMDTDAVIKSMLQIQQLKVDRELRKRTTLEWRQESLKNLSSDFKEFKQTFMSALSPKNMYASSVYSQFNVSVTGEKSSAVTVKAGAGVSNGDAVTINSISQLAEGAKIESGGGVSRNSNQGLAATNSTQLKDLDFKNKLEFVNGEISFSLNGEIFRFKETDTLQNMINTVNASGAGVKMSYSRLTDGFTFETTQTGSEARLDVENIYGNAFGYKSAFGIDMNVGHTMNEFERGPEYRGSNPFSNAFLNELTASGNGNDLDYIKGLQVTHKAYGSNGIFSGEMTIRNSSLSFNINGEEVKIDLYKQDNDAVTNGYTDYYTTESGETYRAKTIGEVLDEVNNSGVAKEYGFSIDLIQPDKDEYAFRVYNGGAVEYGADGLPTGNTLDRAMSVENRTDSTQMFGAGGLFGIDFNAGGTSMTAQGKDAILEVNGKSITRDSNTFSVDGFTYTLNSTFDASEGPVKAEATQNADATIEKFREFVTGYNTMIEKLTKMVTERKTGSEKSYEPLTAEEKEAMTEEQVKQWEEIAKKGLLYNDRGLQNVLSSLRTALYDTVSGVGMSAADIGLRTSADWIGKSGQIELDEVRLREALEKDPDIVARIMTDLSESEDATTKYNENGLLNKISSIFDNYIDGSQTNTLDSITRTMTTVNDKIEQLEQRMLDLEEKYYKQYAAMETALSQIQSQSDWLTQMLSSM